MLFYLAGKMHWELNFKKDIETLRRFGRAEETATTNYLTYLADGIKQGALDCAGQISIESEIELNGSSKGWPAVIGNPEFVRDAMSGHAIGNVRRHRKADYDYVLKKLHDKICTTYFIGHEELFRKARQNNRAKARSIFSYKAHVEELLPLSVISKYLNISITAIANQVNRAKATTKE